MNNQILQLYAFLQASRGNWRNAIWIECKFCLYKNQQCDEYLLAADRNGAPLVFPWSSSGGSQEIRRSKTNV